MLQYSLSNKFVSIYEVLFVNTEELMAFRTTCSYRSAVIELYVPEIRSSLFLLNPERLCRVKTSFVEVPDKQLVIVVYAFYILLRTIS